MKRIMNSNTKKSRPLFWFSLLVAYVILQFTWWSFLMVELNNEIYHLKTELNLLKGESLNEVVVKGNELNEKLHHRWIMIAGEGSVFVGVLFLGIYQIRKTFKKETKLVENILLAAKIENNFYTLHKEEYNLSEYLAEGMRQTIESFKYKQKVILDIEPSIFMEIDRTNFPSIILNLFENAVKYSPEDSTITIRLKKQNQKIILNVEDEGSGISDDEKNSIFGKFYRIGSEETRKTKGTGLGLYIVKYLVEQHNGTIKVKNNFPKGSNFEIVFAG
jgi:signal transduction histidine kinase